MKEWKNFDEKSSNSQMLNHATHMIFVLIGLLLIGYYLEADRIRSTHNIFF